MKQNHLTFYHAALATLLIFGTGLLLPTALQAQQATEQGEQTEQAAPAELATLGAIQQLLDGGEVDAALDELDRRIAADFNDIQARFLKGLVLMEQGDNDAALVVFSEMARLFPKLPETFNNMAAIYVSQGDYEKARQALSSARANAPDYPLVNANLGDLYVKMAVDAYQQALDLDADDDASRAKLELLQQLFASPGS